MENNEYDSVYEGISSVYDEELSEVDSVVSDSEFTEPEQDDVTSESDDTLLDSESSEEVDSYEDICTSSIFEASSISGDSVSTPAVTIVDDSVESSSYISDNEYLYGIYTNTTHSVIFEFVIILLLICVFFSRFLTNLIL